MIEHGDQKNQVVVVNSQYLKTSTLIPDQHSQAMVYAYLSRVDEKSEGFEKISFKVSEIKRITGMPRNLKPKEIMERFSKNLQKSFHYESNDDIKYFAGIFQYMNLDKNKKEITLEIHQDLIEVFKHLKRDFTKIQYEHIKYFKSRYTTKIFEEIVSQYMLINSKGGSSAKITKTLNELNEIYQTEYNTKDFENIVLKRIKKDINDSMKIIDPNTKQVFSYIKERKNSKNEILIHFVLEITE